MPYPADLFTAQWIWEGASQLAEDAYVNTYHFKNDAVVTGNFDNIVDLLRDFYTAAPPDQTNKISEYMTTEAITGKWTCKIYDMSDAKPRVPVYEDTGMAPISQSSTLPTECASVLSFQGERIAGEVQARRRNRVYLGPFMITGLSEGRVSNGLVELILFAAKELLRASNASVAWQWVIYSPSNNDIVAIEDGWVDNAWDTQRRRGQRATARGTWSSQTPTA
jgi:hypothetical protein